MNEKLTAAQVAGMSDSELNRAIAEALGWTKIDFYRHGPESWWGGIPPGEKYDTNFRNWATDANTALELLTEVKYGWQLGDTHPDFLRDGAAPFECSIYGSDSLETVYRDKTPARAVSGVYLLWKQEQS